MVAVCSGANMDFDRLRFVSERADSSETLISATIPERPGAFQVRFFFWITTKLKEEHEQHDLQTCSWGRS